MPASSPGELLQIRILREMSAAQRLRCAFDWIRLTYEIMLAGIRAQQPGPRGAALAAEVRRRSFTNLPAAETSTITEPIMATGGATDSFGVPHQFAAVIEALERSAIPYALTGSLASIVWGRPRATYDADFVIALRAADVDRLLAVFPVGEWYLDREKPLEAVRDQGECNAIHMASATKIDFWLKNDRPADALRFARRRREKLAGVDCWVLSPEDTILAKLEWSALSPSERQTQDIAGIIEIQAGRLELDYLREWADVLQVRGRLKRCFRRARDSNYAKQRQRRRQTASPKPAIAANRMRRRSDAD